jgi:hypothetical protein
VHTQLNDRGERRNGAKRIGTWDKLTKFICEYFMKADKPLEGLKPGRYESVYDS